jgi:4'-phosphopantetheinyl transferase
MMAVGQSAGSLAVELWMADARSPEARKAASEIPLPDASQLEAMRQSERERRRVQLALRRSVISARLGIATAELSLEEGPGRGIACPGLDLQLSVAHHDDHTVLAIAKSGEGLGVDIEPYFETDWEEALDVALSTTEREALDALASADRAAAYFTCWTQKEAVMKALGEGLSDRDLLSIEVGVGIGAPWPALRTLDGSTPTEPWALWSGTVGDLICSVAARGATAIRSQLHCWPLDLDRGFS